MSLGPAEILVVLLVALIFLGPKRLPDAARQLGKAMREFKSATSGIEAELRDALHSVPGEEPKPDSVIDLSEPKKAGAPTPPATS